MTRGRWPVRHPIGSALLGLGLFLLAGCEDPPGLVIGAVLPMTGPAGSVGEDIRDGLALAIEDINARGGAAGGPVVLVLHDAAGSAQATLAAYDAVRAADPPPDVLVAGTSGVSMALRDRAEADGQLLFGLVASAPDLTAGTRSVYRYFPTAEQELPILADVLPDSVKTLTVFHQDDPYGTAVFDQIETRLGPRGMAITGLSFSLGRTDFDALVANTPEPEAVAVVGFAGPILGVLGALRAQGFDGPVVSTTTATLPEVVRDPVADGVRVVAPAIYNRNYAFADDVRTRFETRHDRPFNQYVANGYDFAMMVAGLMEGGPTGQTDLRAQLQDGFLYSGLFGNVSLEAGQQDIAFPLFPARISDGRLIYR
ncbi:ABC transporter substrate-binding protein [Roseospira navarrensis]|uniref:ABC transporter substrate-binding protein n=1 Tax=Roseospira navarrensis TaxID=140058 RepID=A0A7X2D5M2_9PROT|nr:ABC transporter substrate-binding protein [Roseospira navarrensis]MQX37822.1 ABC transporter substrate-binding protein [Roseospira navarrensis]